MVVFNIEIIKKLDCVVLGDLFIHYDRSKKIWYETNLIIIIYNYLKFNKLEMDYLQFKLYKSLEPRETNEIVTFTSWRIWNRQLVKAISE